MLMTDIKLKIPASAKTYIMDTTTEQLRNALLLYPSIANDTISHGKAAELLGMHKAELIELYGNLGIPYLDLLQKLIALQYADLLGCLLPLRRTYSCNEKI